MHLRLLLIGLTINLLTEIRCLWKAIFVRQTFTFRNFLSRQHSKMYTGYVTSYPVRYLTDWIEFALQPTISNFHELTLVCSL